MPSAKMLPTIPFGPYRLSRLIVGANPINGGSHLSRFVNLQMKRYFTPERVLWLLRTCEAEGINAWQSNPANLDLYAQHRAEGGGLHYISLAHDDPQTPDAIERILASGAIAIAHHGEFTDQCYKEGRLDAVRAFLERTRARIRAASVERPVLLGVSTHMPAVVMAIEEAGWEVDFYMTCAYERHRTREELQALLGHVPVPVREVYLEEDPPRMYAAMRATRRPCLAFKILAAGRLCDRQEAVEAAFAETLRQIKPNDALIVGLYPEFEDQVRLDADYVRRYGATGREGAA